MHTCRTDYQEPITHMHVVYFHLKIYHAMVMANKGPELIKSGPPLSRDEVKKTSTLFPMGRGEVYTLEKSNSGSLQLLKPLANNCNRTLKCNINSQNHCRILTTNYLLSVSL